VARASAVGRSNLQIAERLQAIDQHQGADPAQDDHVEQADHDIDLPGRLERLEHARAEQRADQAAGDHHAGHLHVDSAAAHMDHGAGDAGAGDLGRGGGDCDRRRDSIENEQRRRQEPAADPEHARQQPDDEAEQDDEDGIDRLAGDREVNVHPAEGLAANGGAGQVPRR
jgi:hypothetical protein